MVFKNLCTIILLSSNSIFHTLLEVHLYAVAHRCRKEIA